MSTKVYEPQAAAWVKKTSKGDDYLSVKLADGTWVNLFKNTYKKEGDKQPDWREGKKKDENQTPEPSFNQSEDIPF